LFSLHKTGAWRGYPPGQAQET